MLYSQRILLKRNKFILDRIQIGNCFYIACLSSNKFYCVSTLCWQMQMKLMEMKDVENHNNQLNWCSSPNSVLVNGTTDYCSLSTSSSETANLNEHAECQSTLESEPIHQESPVSLIIPHPSYSASEKKINTDPSVVGIVPNMNMCPCLI